MQCAPTLSPLKRALTRKMPRGQRMTAIDRPLTGSGNLPNILDRERIIATAGFNRWLVPPAALCIHLCIGMAYGFSVFWLPLSRALRLTALQLLSVRAHRQSHFARYARTPMARL